MFGTAISTDFVFEVGAVLLSWLILIYARTIGEQLNVIDYPDGLRKVHETATPLVAGFGILIPLFMWCSATLALGSTTDTSMLLVVLLCGLGATVVGYADDQSSTSPSSRLISILLFAAIALVLDRSLVPSAISFLGRGPLPLQHGLAFVLVSVALLGFVNAVNMADGQNGVVIGMVAVWSGCIALVSSGATSAIALTMLITSLTAFAFNLAGRVFLGDSGTYGVGFVIGLLAISAHNNGDVPAQTVCVWFFFPVLDCLRLIVKRMWHKRYPFGADRDHFHHHLHAWLGQTWSLAVYLGVTAVTSVISTLDPAIAPACLIALAALYFAVILPSKDRAKSNSDLAVDGQVELLSAKDGITVIAEHRKRAGEAR